MPRIAAIDKSGYVIGALVNAGYGTILPVGTLLCDGSAVSRTTYPYLFAAIGTAWGSGDGSTTFNLPDARGKFVRGQNHGTGNDPNASARTANASGGATGDNVGSIQTDAMQPITGEAHVQANGSGNFWFPVGDKSGAFTDTTSAPSNRDGDTTTANSAYLTTSGLRIDSTLQTRTSPETRPLNIYANIAIAYI